METHEKEIRLEPVRIYLICDRCDKIMQNKTKQYPNRTTLPYTYQCPVCKETTETHNNYPYIDFQEKTLDWGLD